MRARAPLYVALVAAPLALSTVITWAVDRNNNTVDLVIREARLDDAEAIGDISGRGWVAAYAGLLPAGFLASRASAPLGEEWRANT